MNTDHISVNTQSSIRIEGSRILYFDPFKIAEKAGDADLIFITHPHFDHFDEAAIANISNEKTVFVAPASMKKEAEKAAGGRQLLVMKPGEDLMVGEVRIHAVPAYNKLKPFHPKRNGWLGYVVEMDGVTYYAAGDTDAVKELTALSCDIALVPIGGTYTMTAVQAAELVNAIHPVCAIPIHYGDIVGTAKDADVFAEKLDKEIEVVRKLKV
jgi:L-ascorbate metabolism protein UlaG (beta-lactamase superfamily)